MRVTYENWIVLHHKNIQQSTAGQYSHVVIDTHVHIHKNIKGDRKQSWQHLLTIIPEYNCK